MNVKKDLTAVIQTAINELNALKKSINARGVFDEEALLFADDIESIAANLIADYRKIVEEVEDQ